MKELKTLIVNGNEYTVTDPNAARINNAVVGQAVWSSKNMIDRLCPVFTARGAVVTCAPVVGYPLEVVSYIQPAQAGSGDPSPDNVRPIIGWENAKLSLTDDTQVQEFSMDLGQTVYGGSLNWQTGVLTVDKQVQTFKGTEKWTYSTPQAGYCRIQYSGGGVFSKETCVCSHYIMRSNYSSSYTFPYLRCNDGTSNWVYEGKQDGGFFASADDFKAYLAEQYAAGTPVQVVCKREDPITVQLTPQEVFALSDANTLYSDSGDTAVTGRSDPTVVIEKLTSALIALGGNV